MAQNGTLCTVINIPLWLAHTTLDVIGRASFDHDFGAIDEREDECSAIYKKLFADSFFKHSNLVIVFEALWGYLPLWIVTTIHMLPTPNARDYGSTQALYTTSERPS
ncbi:hypothetical protein JB92DRAFT_1139445 [Gautieria morchelliformis]|nr:hypothetical protein JB92DRAFT_1139445 [Gautieria morchelliformis]